jgi:transposase
MLTVLQEQLGDVHGLAMAASETVDRVESRLLDRELRRRLDELRLDVAEIRGRCLEAGRSYGEELAAEILARANTVGERAADLAGAWFKAGTGPLEAWSFLAMGEAGELSSWSALHSLAERDGELAELAAWGVEVQRRHLELVLDGAPLVAELLDPAGPRWG